MIEQNPEQMAVGLLTAPVNAVTEDGEWLVLAFTKGWSSREGRRGTVDPSGGMTFAPAYGMELRVAFALVDDPTTEPPPGTLSEASYQHILGRIATMTKEAFVPDNSRNDF